MHQLVYSQLMTIDPDLRVAPGLASRLDNPDPLTYIAHLRSGVKFHDGHELTAKDVVYTFSSFLDPDFVSARRVRTACSQSVTALDDYQVEFKLKEPFGSFPDSAGRCRSCPTGPETRCARFRSARDRTASSGTSSTSRWSSRPFEGYWDGLPAERRHRPADRSRRHDARPGIA